MGKKKILLILLLLLVTLAAVAYFLQQKGDLYADVDISLSNTDQIEEVFLSDMANNNIKLKKNGKIWILNDSLEAREDAIVSLMQTVRVQKPQQPVSAKQSDYVISTLSTHGTKVILYGKNHKELLTYFVGGQGDKGIGTYMYKQGADKPYLYNATGFTGDLATRYFTKQDEWMSRKLMRYESKDVNLLQVYYNDHPDSSFIIKGLGASRVAINGNGETIPTDIGKLNALVTQVQSQSVSGWENSAFAKDSLMNRNRYYGNILVGKASSKQVDTFQLFYCPADPLGKEIREIEGNLYDMHFLFVYHKNNLGLITSQSLADLLVTPSKLQ